MCVRARACARARESACMCVWSTPSVIMTDKRQAESQQTDSDHTRVLPFLLFATQSRFFFFFLDVAAAIDKSAVVAVP